MNWHPESHYTPSRFGVDGLVLIECLAFALIAIAAAVLGYL